MKVPLRVFRAGAQSVNCPFGHSVSRSISQPVDQSYGQHRSAEQSRQFMQAFEYGMAHGPDLRIRWIHIRNHDDRASGREGRTNSIEAVLNYQALCRRKGQLFACDLIHVRCRLAPGHFVSAQDEFHFLINSSNVWSFYFCIFFNFFCSSSKLVVLQLLK